MRGFDRNIKYTARTALWVSCIAYLVAVPLVVWVYIVRGDDILISAQSLIYTFIDMAVSMGAMLIFIYSAVNSVNIFPLLVSCGSTRKCAALGMVMFNVFCFVLQMVVNGILYGISNIVFNQNASLTDAMSNMLIVYLVCSALGYISGLLTLKLGRIGYTISVGLGCLLYGFGYGFLTSMIADGAESIYSALIISDSLKYIMCDILLIGVNILVAFIYMKALRKIEVRV